MPQPLFSFGTSRGGTTFFARILSVNNGAKIASDPFLPLFREFRNQIMKTYVDASFDTSKPLDDYYHLPSRRAILDVIQKVGLELPLNQGSLPMLRESLAARMNLAAKELIPIAQRMKGDSFAAFLECGLDLMTEVYQAQDTQWIGANDNWVIEFLPHLASTFSKGKFIVVMRDPRASIASSLKLRDTEPTLVPLIYSFARHWRKHAAFAWKFKNDPQLKDRIFFLKYEDLVLCSQSKVQELCHFLEIDFDLNMIDPAYFRPIKGNKWTAYSHFDVSGDKIYTDAIAMWKKYLDRQTIEFIEFVCGPEMSLWGYDVQTYQGGEGVVDFMIKDDKVALGWRGDYLSWKEEYAFECRRRSLLESSEVKGEGIIPSHFLFQEVFESCKRRKGSI